MSTFYVLPPRPVLGERFAGYLKTLFPGLDWNQAAWTELADDTDSMPVLVVRSRQKRPLLLGLRESGAAAVVVDRALFRVTVGEDGHQGYQADYRFGKLLTGALDVEWPASPAGP